MAYQQLGKSLNRIDAREKVTGQTVFTGDRLADDFLYLKILFHRQIVLEDSQKIWKVMIKPNDNSVKIPHDGYLKVFQLENPNLHSIYPHDVLMIGKSNI